MSGLGLDADIGDATGVAVEHPPVHTFDLSCGPHKLTRREWNPRRTRQRAELRGVVLHQWNTPVGTTPANRARHGEEEALARRALATPYTVCAGVAQHSGAPVVVLAHPPWLYTHASDAANAEWLAVGVMGRFPFIDDEVPEGSARVYTPDTTALRAAVAAALGLAVELLGGASAAKARPFSLITHRQAVNGLGDHRECPGEAVVRMALASEVVAQGLLAPDPDLVLVPAWGRSWPPAWRRHIPAVPPAISSPQRAPAVAPVRPPVVQSIPLDDD